MFLQTSSFFASSLYIMHMTSIMLTWVYFIRKKKTTKYINVQAIKYLHQLLVIVS